MTTNIQSKNRASLSRASEVLPTIVLASAILLVLATYYWIDYSSRIELSHFPTEIFYPGLAKSFLEGHTYLDVQPNPKLLELPNPYDPALNKDLTLFNASLYHNKYYPYFGPAPAIVLFVPYRLLFNQDLSQATAVFIFGSLTFLFSSFLFLRLIRDFFPQVSLYWKTASIFLLGLASAFPFLLRRPDVYEVAISCASCSIFFTFVSVYFSQRSKRFATFWLFLAAAGITCSMGARCDYLPVIAPFLGLLIYFCVRNSFNHEPRPWLPLVAIVPIGAGLLSLAIYNYVRFGGISDIGNEYQLGDVDETKIRFTGFDNILYNIWFYIFSQPDFLARFPFTRPSLNICFALPNRFFGLEYVSGIAYISPVSLIGLAYPLICYKFFRGKGDSLFITLGFISISCLLTFGVVLCYSGATMRYFIDFLPGFLLLGCVTMCHYLRSTLEIRRLHNYTRIFFNVMIFTSIFYGLCFSVGGYHNLLLKNSPETYRKFEQFFSFCAFEKIRDGN